MPCRRARVRTHHETTSAGVKRLVWLRRARSCGYQFKHAHCLSLCRCQRARQHMTVCGCRGGTRRALHDHPLQHQPNLLGLARAPSRTTCTHHVGEALGAVGGRARGDLAGPQDERRGVDGAHGVGAGAGARGRGCDGRVDVDVGVGHACVAGGVLPVHADAVAHAEDEVARRRRVDKPARAHGIDDVARQQGGTVSDRSSRGLRCP